MQEDQQINQENHVKNEKIRPDTLSEALLTASPVEQPSDEPSVSMEDSNLPETPEDTSSNKRLFIIIGVIVIIILAIIFGLRSFNPGSPTGDAALSIDELHEMNLRGDLPAEQGYVFKGFSFVHDNLWYADYVRDGVTYQLALHEDPKSLRSIELNGTINRVKYNELFYITFDPLNTDSYVSISVGEITKILAGVEFKNVIPACTVNETDACADRPIVNCDDMLTQTKPVIEIRNEGEPGIHTRRNCIVITGQGEELVKASERLIYEWLEIL